MLNRSGFLIGDLIDDGAEDAMVTLLLIDYNYSYANDDGGEPDDDDQDGQRQQYFRWRRTVGAD